MTHRCFTCEYYSRTSPRRGTCSRDPNKGTVASVAFCSRYKPKEKPVGSLLDRAFTQGWRIVQAQEMPCCGHRWIRIPEPDTEPETETGCLCSFTDHLLRKVK